MGDYSHIVAQGEIIRPVWARMDNGRVSVWSAVIDPNSLTSLSDSEKPFIPEKIMITAVYPNPFNASTKIQYKIPCNGWVEVKIYDITGKLINHLFSSSERAGEYTITWNAANLSSGIYIISLALNHQITSKKVMLLK
jgi:hypothetical protein